MRLWGHKANGAGVYAVALVGQAEPEDKVTERKMKSLKKAPSGQISFL